MSYQATAWVYTVKNLTIIERIVLGYLAMRQNSKTKKCICSVKAIEESCEISRSSVFRALEGLKKKNHIKPSRRYGKSKWQLASSFDLLLDTTPSLTDTTQCPLDTPLESGSESGSESYKKQPPSVSAFSSLKLGDLSYGADYPTLEDCKNKFDLLLKSTESDMKAEDFLIEHQNSLTLESALLKVKGKPLSSQRLYTFWRELNAVFKTKTFIVESSHKTAGQFALLGKKLGPAIIPTMMEVVQNWTAFGKFLKEQGVVHDFPDTPHAGFFLKHGEIATQFHSQASKPLGGLKPYVIMK